MDLGDSSKSVLMMVFEEPIDERILVVDWLFSSMDGVDLVSDVSCVQHGVNPVLILGRFY